MMEKVSRYTKSFPAVNMMGVSAIVLCAVMLAGRMPSLAQQPGGQPPGGQSPGGQPPGGGRGGFGGPGGFDPAQMIDRMLEWMQLSDADRAAAKETWLAKNTARTALREKVDRLREMADNAQSSDADITKALSEFATAYGAYAKTVSEADAKLVKKISLRTRARLTVFGILENGVGFGGGFRVGGFGPPGGGGSPGGSGGGERSGGQ